MLLYYENFRPDFLAHVPIAAKYVLSVGRGAGKTEEELVKRGINVVGVEINPEAAMLARKRGLTVLEGDASEVDISLAGKPYDCLIYADVMEHLPDPLGVLKRHVESLNVGGIVYVCVPNFRHYSVLWQLFILGHIHYKDSGILDRAHLRITTHKTVLEWFERAGIELLNCKYVAHRRRDKLVSACTLSLAREFTSVQIVLVGRKR